MRSVCLRLFVRPKLAWTWIFRIFFSWLSLTEPYLCISTVWMVSNVIAINNHSRWVFSECVCVYGFGYITISTSKRNENEREGHRVAYRIIVVATVSNDAIHGQQSHVLRPTLCVIFFYIISIKNKYLCKDKSKAHWFDFINFNFGFAVGIGI